MVVINLTPWQLLIWLAILVVPMLLVLGVQHIRRRRRRTRAGLWTCDNCGCGWTNTSTDTACQRCGSPAIDGYGFRL